MVGQTKEKRRMPWTACCLQGEQETHNSPRVAYVCSAGATWPPRHSTGCRMLELHIRAKPLPPYHPSRSPDSLALNTTTPAVSLSSAVRFGCCVWGNEVLTTRTHPTAKLVQTHRRSRCVPLSMPKTDESVPSVRMKFGHVSCKQRGRRHQ